jgi:hypothetical protein
VAEIWPDSDWRAKSFVLLVGQRLFAFIGNRIEAAARRFQKAFAYQNR